MGARLGLDARSACAACAGSSDGDSDPQDGLIAVVSATADLWLVWRF